MDKRAYWVLMLCASAILMITMGVRQSLGLFVSPLNTSRSNNRSATTHSPKRSRARAIFSGR